MENKFLNPEHEKTYYVEKESEFNRVVEVLNLMPSYVVSRQYKTTNVDIYYDTPDKMLSSFNASIRTRRNEAKQWLGIKYVKREFIDKRFINTTKEFATEIEYNENFLDNDNLLLYLDDKLRDVYSFRVDVDVLRLLKKLKPFLVIESKRDVLEIKNNDGFEAEVCLDKVYFSGKRKRHNDLVVEIKLNSIAAKNNLEYYNRFVTDLEKRAVLIPMEETKYEAGLRSLTLTKEKVNKKDKDKDDDKDDDKDGQN